MAIEERLQRLEECVLLTGTSSQRIHPQSDYSERKRNPNGVSAMGLGHREAAETMFFDTMAPADLATPMLRLVEDDHEGLKMTGTDSSAPKDVTPKPFVQRSLDAKLFQFPERSEAYRLLRVFESETAPLYVGLLFYSTVHICRTDFNHRSYSLCFQGAIFVPLSLCTPEFLLGNLLAFPTLLIGVLSSWRYLP